MNVGKRRARLSRSRLNGPGPGLLGEARSARTRDRIAKAAIVATAILATTAIVMGFGPAFTYRIGQRPNRQVRVRVPQFARRNQIKTNALRQAAADAVKPRMENDPTPIKGLADRLHDLIDLTARTSKLEGLPEAIRTSWSLSKSGFDDLREACDTEARRRDLHRRIDLALAPILRDGLLGTSALPPQEDAVVEVDVRSKAEPEKGFHRVPRDRVETLHIVKPDESTGKEFIAAFSSPELGKTIFGLAANRLAAIPTLSYLDGPTTEAREIARAGVQDVFDMYRRGEVLVDQGEEINEEQLVLLKLEHETEVKRLKIADWLRRGAGTLVLTSALFVLLAHAIRFHEPSIVRDRRKLAAFSLLIVGSLGIARLIAHESWDAEAAPIGIAGMLAAIAYSPRLGLVVTFALCLLTTLALGMGVGTFLVLMGGAAAGVMALDQVRTRTKLIKVGATAGAAYFLLTWGVGLCENQPLPLTANMSLWRGGWGLMTGFFLGGCLPFVESAFGIITGISLLELGDMTHPLLQELAARAPGTHNHSMAVATIAEAAAERIGGDGLLVRIGAYFHDIGKMLKPRYFIENQTGALNRHANLAPAMSTLIIIGHVKDGADLARRRRLPEPIIDLIEQHHGTTLVEFFYQEAARRRHDQLDDAPPQESAYRYPGPKPRTKEAAVLMMADAVESAGRTLSEPTPARIESLVGEIVDKRLRDGQFDECGLTLREVALVRESLIKSLIGIYHNRIKYPEQRTA